jgi:hypothetical protein
MTYTRSIAFWAAALGLAACSAGVKPSTPGTAGSSGGGGGATGNAGAMGGGGTGATNVDANVPEIATGADRPGDGACSANSIAAERVPLDLYVLMDSSLSMNEMPTAGTTKWSNVRMAMKSFFESSSSAGLGVGLKYFPGVQSGAMPTCAMEGTDAACGDYGPCERRKTCVGASSSTTAVSPLCVDATTCGTQTCALIRDCGSGNYCAAGATAPGTACSGCTDFAGYCQRRDICDPAYYATPDVPVGMLTGTAAGQAATLWTSLMGHDPAGYTPTGPALQGALTFARQRIAAMPTHRVAVVLVTDGLPGGFLPGFPPAQCMPGDIAGISALASGAQGAGGSPPVPTFVIGVFSPGAAATTAQTNLDMLAKAGQANPDAKAVIITTGADITTPLTEALKQVQSRAIACDFQVPSQGVNFKEVNVTFTNGAGTTVTPIGHAPIDGTDGSGCDARGGWYYDKDPMTAAPTKITACPATCAMLQTDLDGKVDVVLGCPTIDVG